MLFYDTAMIHQLLLCPARECKPVPFPLSCTVPVSHSCPVTCLLFRSQAPTLCSAFNFEVVNRSSYSACTTVQFRSIRKPCDTFTEKKLRKKSDKSRKNYCEGFQKSGVTCDIRIERNCTVAVASNANRLPNGVRQPLDLKIRLLSLLRPSTRRYDQMRYRVEPALHTAQPSQRDFEWHQHV